MAARATLRKFNLACELALLLMGGKRLRRIALAVWVMSAKSAAAGGPGRTAEARSGSNMDEGREPLRLPEFISSARQNA